MLLNEKNSRLTLCGELALLVAVIINSFSVVLMLYSGSGISAISSVPFAFSEAFPKLTLGTWTYIFQGLLIASLMYLRKKFIASYMFSFVVGFVFSQFLDLFELYINMLPQAFSWRVLYFVVSYILICIGIALSNRCGLPIIPTDLFPRELSSIIKIEYAKIKMTLFLLGHIDGLGIGTILAAFTMGKGVAYAGQYLDKNFQFMPYLQKD